MTNLETTRTAGAATPCGPWPASVEKKSNQSQGIRDVCSDTSLDQRLDDLISIADLTGATLDAVVATVGRLPEATFAATIDVLAALSAPPAPTDLQDLLQAHRAVTDSLVDAKSDACVEDIDRQISELEQRIMTIPARSAAEAYGKLLAVFPEIRFDLEAPDNAPLRAEIEAEIGGEV